MPSDRASDGPLVTIGMPVYNNGATLARAITSVLAQDFGGWRLIVTVDPSSDDSLSVAEAFAEKDDRIEVVRNEKRLHFMNFRQSLRQAETPWFIWLAGDDYWAAGCLKACLAVADANPKAVSVLPGWRHTGVSERSRPWTATLDQATPRARIKRFFAAPGGTRMYGLTRTDLLQASFPKRIVNAYDWFLMLGVLGQGPQMSTPEVLLFRERTALKDYTALAETLHRGLFRRFPVLRMSLAAALAGRVPFGCWRDLF